MLRHSFALALLFLAGGAALADDGGVGDTLDGLSGAKALAFVKELSADGMEGRRTGFAGGQKAENWVIEKMSEFGLHPADAGGTYLEPFTFKASEVTAPIQVKVGAKALTYGTDFVEMQQTGGGKASGEAVFLGFGIRRPDIGWDDYAGVDVKGKIALVMRGAPRAREHEFGDEIFIGHKMKEAADAGAAAFLLVDEANALAGAIMPQYIRPRVPAIWVSRAIADSIVASKGKTIARLKGQRDAGNPAQSFATGTTVSVDLQVKWHAAAKGHNALGAIHGRDPDLKHEIVLVAAHMDHIGTGYGGTPVFNGADDNASGVAVMAHLIDVLKANRWKPKRTIIFCAFGAEEQGLIGANALATRYPFEGRIVTVLNMDMVGQGEPAIWFAGGGSYPWMDKRFKAWLPDALKAKTTFSRRAGDRGDHWPFHARGIPAFFIRSKGEHLQYHTPNDVAANVKPDVLEATARIVGTLLVNLGNCTERLEMPGSFYHYLLREAPLFGMADLKNGQVVARDVGAAVPTGWIVTVKGNAQAAWRQLELLGQDARYRLVTRAADVGRAWYEGRAPLVPRLVLDQTDALDRYIDMGYRWVVSGAPEVLKVVQGKRVIAEFKSSESSALQAGSDELLLLMTDQLLSEKLDDARVFVAGLSKTPAGGDATSLSKVLGAWSGAKKPGWWLPGSPQRKAIRAALGGWIVEWLQRTER